MWKYCKNWDGAIPGKFTCDVIATVKNPLPEIDPEKVYKFQTKSSSSLQLFDETGYMNLPVWDNGSKDIDHTMPMGGVDNVTKYVTVKNSEVVILKSSYTINN